MIVHSWKTFNFNLDLDERPKKSESRPDDRLGGRIRWRPRRGLPFVWLNEWLVAAAAEGRKRDRTERGGEPEQPRLREADPAYLTTHLLQGGCIRIAYSINTISSNKVSCVLQICTICLKETYLQTQHGQHGALTSLSCSTNKVILPHPVLTILHIKGAG